MENIKSKIIDGVDIPLCRLTFLVMLAIQKPIYRYCSGSIVSMLPGQCPQSFRGHTRHMTLSPNAQYIMTAAHCVVDTDPRDITIYQPQKRVVNATHEKTVLSLYGHIDTIHVHPNFQVQNFSYDVALLHLSLNDHHRHNKTVVCEDTLQYAHVLPKNGTVYESIDTRLDIAGFGKTKFSDSLSNKKYVDDDIFPLFLQGHVGHVIIHDRQQYQHVLPTDDTMLIANGIDVYTDGTVTDSCGGDSGGPLFTQLSETSVGIIGMVSWGISCGIPSLPGVYSKLSAAMEWILSVVCS